MTQSNEALSEAIYDLRQAVQSELMGNRYYMVAYKVTELGELFSSGIDQGAQKLPRETLSFESAVDGLRRKAESELTDNRYYAFAHKLDALKFVARIMDRDRAIKSAIAVRPVTLAAQTASAPSSKPSAVADETTSAVEAARRYSDTVVPVSKDRLDAAENTDTTPQSFANTYQAEIRSNGDLQQPYDASSGARSAPVAPMETATIHSNVATGEAEAGNPPYIGLSTVKSQVSAHRSTPSASEKSATPDLPSTTTNHDTALATAGQTLTAQRSSIEPRARDASRLRNLFSWLWGRS